MKPDLLRRLIGYRSGPMTFSQILTRIHSRGTRRVKDLALEMSHRLGILRQEVNLESALLPGIDLGSVKEWGREAKFFLDHAPTAKDELLVTLRRVAPEAEALILREADRICDHVFDLLGSGPTPMGEKIDWHVDFKTGHRWNPKTHYKRIRPAPYPGGYDIKVPWELSRCQHLVRLGQAYWITGDEKYAREFVAQVKDWIESNPWPWGVNWACTMDVAIRAVNWLWGYRFFTKSPTLGDEFRLTFYRGLLVHGRHIFRNLENKGNFTGNHYLSNLVGLVYLGILCPEFKEAGAWGEFGSGELEKEMFKQVHPDGVSFEASTSYHRLVTEMFLSATILIQRNGYHFGEAFMARLGKMVEFVMYITKPDGTVPLIGDNDNGRLHRLRTWESPEREWVDFRDLLAIGSVLFRRHDFALAAGELWEESVWLLGERAFTWRKVVEGHSLSPLALESHAFPNAGWYVIRQRDIYMATCARANDQETRSVHAHNDTMSFELYAHGCSWIMDPGTHTYTANYLDRYLFRSSAYHNTVVIDEQESTPIDPRSIFGTPLEPVITVNDWVHHEKYNMLDIQHEGYLRLDQPLAHRRRILFAKSDELWLIWDQLIGRGRHKLDLFFHLRPVRITRLDDGMSLQAVSEESQFLMLALIGDPLVLDIERGTFSPSYGTRRPALVAHYHACFDAPLNLVFALQPILNIRSIDLPRCRERANAVWGQWPGSTRGFGTIK